MSRACDGTARRGEHPLRLYMAAAETSRGFYGKRKFEIFRETGKLSV
jgi:hypothetical protein